MRVLHDTLGGYKKIITCSKYNVYAKSITEHQMVGSFTYLILLPQKILINTDNDKIQLHKIR